MSIRINHDPNAPTASVELPILQPLPDYDLEEIEQPTPRDVDPLLASQGFKDLLDEALARAVVDVSGRPFARVEMPREIAHAFVLTTQSTRAVLTAAREQLRASVAQLAVTGAARILEKEVDAKSHAKMLESVVNQL